MPDLRGAFEHRRQQSIEQKYTERCGQCPNGDAEREALRRHTLPQQRQQRFQKPAIQPLFQRCCQRL